MKKIIIAILAVLGFATPASAGDRAIMPTCDGLIVSLRGYEEGRIRIWIDGNRQLELRTFDGDFSETFPWTQTEEHTYSVEITNGESTVDVGNWTACAPTTTVGVPEPTPPTTVAPMPTVQPAPSIPSLPRTGADENTSMMIGMFSIIIGLLCLSISRRIWK